MKKINRKQKGKSIKRKIQEKNKGKIESIGKNEKQSKVKLKKKEIKRIQRQD